MSSFKSDDQSFSQLMQKSKLEMPYSDFEDNVMLRIQREASLKKSFWGDTKLSIMFFFLGTSLGLIINNMLMNVDLDFSGLSSGKIQMGFQIVYVLFFITQLDAIVKLVRKFR